MDECKKILHCHLCKRAFQYGSFFARIRVHSLLVLKIHSQTHERMWLIVHFVLRELAHDFQGTHLADIEKCRNLICFGPVLLFPITHHSWRIDTKTSLKFGACVALFWLPRVVWCMLPFTCLLIPFLQAVMSLLASATIHLTKSRATKGSACSTCLPYGNRVGWRHPVVHGLLINKWLWAMLVGFPYWLFSLLNTISAHMTWSVECTSRNLSLDVKINTVWACSQPHCWTLMMRRSAMVHWSKYVFWWCHSWAGSI